MAASKIEVVFLHCDQGMGTLVRIFDKSDRLAHLALLDLGCESGTKKYSDTALSSVIRALDQMKADGIKPNIDLVMVSHQDYDHWSLLPDLLAQIQKKHPKCTVGEIYFGGTNWRAKATEAIEEWEDHFDVEAEPFGKSASDFKKPGTQNYFKHIEGVYFSLLCANVPISRSAEDLERNGTSAVVAIDFADVYSIIPGDATADTVGWINKNVFEKWKKAGKSNPVQPCRALGAPHHGALRTLAENYVATAKAKVTFAVTFANFVKAQNVVASAGHYSQFNHPYKSVMELLGKHAVDDAPEHNIVWYDGALAKWAQEDDDERGIFTTVTRLKSPPTRTGWRFTITSSGKITFYPDWEQEEVISPFQRVDRYAAVPRTK